ncbi:MAG: bactofilin family protein [Candidatus Porifericomitaceae bacterium WSBS_2022_MAG_OTU9]
MWSKKVKKTNKINSMIGKDTTIEGNVSFSGGMHVDGTVRGDIHAAKNDSGSALSLSESAVVEGNIEVPFILVNGKVTGNINSSQNLELAANSNIEGDVQYKVLHISLGAKVNGRLRHHEDQRPIVKEETTDAAE